MPMVTMEFVVKRIESLARGGVFGQGQLVEVRSNSDDGKGTQFASELFFLEVILKNDRVSSTCVPIVVKIQVSSGSRDIMGSDVQFAVEASMYQTVLSGLGVTQLNLSPKLLFCHATSGRNPDQDIIALEDLRPAGYKVAPNVFLDYDHVALTMRKLGEFHGLSYKLKRSSSDGLRPLLEQLPERMFVDSGELFKGAFFRGFQPLMCEEKDEVAKQVFDKVSAMSPRDAAKSFHKPEEPFAVIVHGDFNKNNILYAYDKQDRVTSVKFFDFATCCYADPAIDIAFFLYINTSPAFREKHWEDVFVQYWEGLMTTASDPGFTFKEFMVNFAKRALYGYLPCCFWLPIVQFPGEMELPVDKFLALSPQEQYERGFSLGGQKVTDSISIIVKHLRKKGYLEQYLLSFK